jgi:site-specific recombinase XerC
VTKGDRRGEVFLPARLIPKLRRFLAWKRDHGESLEPDAPLFVSAQGRRLSPRAAQWRFAWWQERAEFDRHYGFHQLRHYEEFRIMRSASCKLLRLLQMESCVST